MQPFDHHSPGSLPEAFELLEKLDGHCQLIAGGTDLLLQMRSGELAPPAVINIKRIDALKGVHYSERNGLTIGALTTLRELTRLPIIQTYYPALAETARLMASEQIRSFATVGGNLCNGAPSADLAPPFMVLGGRVCLAGPDGERELPVEDFFLGPGSTTLRPHELLKTVVLPPPEGNTIYLKHSARAFMDIAVVGVAIRLQLSGRTCEAIRIALGAVAPIPMRARQAEALLEGQDHSTELISTAASKAASECSPIDDIRSSAWYRRRMVAVFVERGLNHCWTEANNI